MRVVLGKGLLAANAGKARDNRLFFTQRNIAVINLISSPGAGKTTLLEDTLTRLAGLKTGVVEGDLYTALDAERLADKAAGVVQINTEGVCHLNAAMVERAVQNLEGAGTLDLLFIENVGNLVCPAGFDLGEDLKVVLLSVAEGSDKPAKYRQSFAAAQAVVITKADLLPYTDFDLPGVLRTIGEINPDLPVLVTSVRTGEGMAAWCGFLERVVAGKKAGSA